MQHSIKQNESWIWHGTSSLTQNTQSGVREKHKTVPQLLCFILYVYMHISIWYIYIYLPTLGYAPTESSTAQSRTNMELIWICMLAYMYTIYNTILHGMCIKFVKCHSMKLLIVDDTVSISSRPASTLNQAQ